MLREKEHEILSFRTSSQYHGRGVRQDVVTYLDWD